MRRGHQLQCATDAKRRTAGDSGGQPGSHSDDRMSGLEEVVGRLCGDESELLGDWAGHGSETLAGFICSRDGHGGHDAGGEWSGVSGGGLARHSEQRNPLHFEGRRKDGGGDAKASGRAEWVWFHTGGIWHECALQSGGCGGWAYRIGFGEAEKESADARNYQGVERISQRAPGIAAAQCSGTARALYGVGGPAATAVRR